MKNIKTISIVGAGNVGSYFARTFHEVGINIHQVYSRRLDRAKLLAEMVQANPVDDLLQMESTVDVIIVAVSDDAIARVYEKLSELDVGLAHTSGAVETISRSDAPSAVFYPLQTLRKEKYSFDRSLPICITSKEDDFKSQLVELADGISEKVVTISDRDRLKYHLAAVFTNNFSNHLFAKVYDYLDNECLESTLLHALIQKTFDQLKQEDLKTLQTGPARRNDLHTEAKHLSLLNQYADESLMDLYELFSKSIKDYHSD